MLVTFKIFQKWLTWSLIIVRNKRKISYSLKIKLNLETKFVNFKKNLDLSGISPNLRRIITVFYPNL